MIGDLNDLNDLNDFKDFNVVKVPISLTLPSRIPAFGHRLPATAKSERTRELCKNFNNSRARFCNLFVKPDGQSQNLFLLCRGKKRKKKIQHFIRK